MERERWKIQEPGYRENSWSQVLRKLKGIVWNGVEI